MPELSASNTTEYDRIYWQQLSRSIVIWSLFTTALLRTWQLVAISPKISVFILPGAVLYLFLLYFRAKAGRYLDFLHFLAAALIISAAYHTIFYLINKYIALLDTPEYIIKSLVMFLIGVSEASILYLITRVIVNPRKR